MEFLLALGFLASTLLFHEAGHWAALKRIGIPVVEYGVGYGPAILAIGRFRFRVILLGAYVSPDPYLFSKTSDLNRLVVALAGPAASFLYGIAFYIGGTVANETGIVLLGSLSFLIGAFNLIPIPPLDGWWALEAYRSMRGRPITKTASDLAYLFGKGLVALVLVLTFLELLRL